jgi:hypothetical protein
MKALMTLTALLLAVTAQAKSQNPLIMSCANNEYDVTVTLDQSSVKKLSQEIVIVNINDVSGHGKTYTSVLPTGKWSMQLSEGLVATSTEDGGKIQLNDMGNLAVIKGEINLGLQCIDRLSDNPSGL